MSGEKTEMDTIHLENATIQGCLGSMEGGFASLMGVVLLLRVVGATGRYWVEP